MLNNGGVLSMFGHADLSTTQEYTYVTISGLKKNTKKRIRMLKTIKVI